MVALTWDGTGERVYETGIDKGVLYKPNEVGVYDNGFAWNGLVTVTESPSGGEANPQYADNIKYLNLYSAELFGGTIEAYTYPDEFSECDGTATPQPGVGIGQQTRKPFGLSYRTKVGNDLDPDDGYKLHLIYGATAAPSERAYTTINDSPEAITFSWEIATIPTVVGGSYKPTSSIVIDSRKVDATALTALENLLYGTSGTDPSLPTPAYVLDLFDGTITSVVPGIPTYVNGTHTLTIPSTAGVTYYTNNVAWTSGAHVITEDTIVVARPNNGYYFPAGVDDDWFFDFS